MSTQRLDQSTGGRSLDHVEEFELPTAPAGSTKTPSPTPGSASANLPPVLVSSGLPPIPAKLVSRAQHGLFVEMADLLPQKLLSQEYYTGDSTSSPKQKHHDVANIIEWVQCFGIYTAIISKKEPDRTADLIGYQQMIIDSSQNCCEGGWLNYDRHFRLKASATGLKDWSSVEMNIWKRAFPDRVKQFPPQYTPSYTRQGPQRYSANYSQPRERKICLEWNDSPNPNCPYPDCKFEHRCYRCVFNSRVTDTRHKALFCPNMNKRRPLLGAPTTTSHN